MSKITCYLRAATFWLTDVDNFGIFLTMERLSSNELISREFFDYRFQKQKFFLSGTHLLSGINYFYYETKSYFIL